MHFYSLDQLCPGQTAHIKRLHLGGAIGQRLSELGLIEGTPVSCVHRSPAGDPTAYHFRGTVIALRRCDSRQIEVS